jgi:hypothetical protein
MLTFGCNLPTEKRAFYIIFQVYVEDQENQEETKMLKRKITGVFLAAAMLLALFPTGAGAVFAAQDGTKIATVVADLEAMAEDFDRKLDEFQTVAAAGEFLIVKSEMDMPDEDATQISTAQELYNIRNNLGGSYVLTGNINLSGFSGSEWLPIGDKTSPFTGSFDGQGFVIRNLAISDTGYDYNGLFGYIENATIKNVGLEDTNINFDSGTGSDSSVYVGGICGYAVDSVIGNCYNTGDISASNYFYGVYAGGIYGYGDDAVVVTDCYNESAVSASIYPNSFNFVNIGGICGRGGAIIENCYNAGDISGYAPYANAGGICGLGSSAISNCYNTGNVSVSPFENHHFYYVGGICGDARSDSSISNCYNTGTVFASGTWPDVGGICGRAYGISNCYNTGTVSASAIEPKVGGICGDNAINDISKYYVICDTFYCVFVTSVTLCFFRMSSNLFQSEKFRARRDISWVMTVSIFPLRTSSIKRFIPGLSNDRPLAPLSLYRAHTL